ncbi:MAG TPA: lysophospholipid acyltransferase family protein, partial [Deferrisomatales bacterium]|nr:lysophospholipid acyltransferase family protein [Deferrisomatales bacterium]
LAVLGWRVHGQLPDEPRLVVVAAPHTSNWDFVLAMATAFALGVEIRWLGKHSLFRPPAGVLMRWLGGIPVDRGVRSGVVTQSAAALRSQEQMVLCVAPEGTRSGARRWKTGFYHIAREAGVPICLCTLHYPRRTLGLGPVLIPGDDTEADMTAIREFYRPFRGRR